MYCHNCGKEVPLHSAFCLHCGSKTAIQQAVPLPTKAKTKMRKILALSALGVVCLVALIYGLSGNTDQRQSKASLPVSNPTAAPSESPTLGEAAMPAARLSVKAQSKSSAATKSVTGSGSAQLNSAASSAPKQGGRERRPCAQSRPEAEANRRNLLHYQDGRALSSQQLPPSASQRLPHHAGRGGGARVYAVSCVLPVIALFHFRSARPAIDCARYFLSARRAQPPAISPTPRQSQPIALFAAFMISLLHEFYGCGA